MKIDAIHVVAADRDQRLLVVRIDSAGVSGFGEAAIDAEPIATEQWLGGSAAFIEQCLTPLLVGREVTSVQSLAEVLSHFRGHSLAKGAVDLAWHDLSARMAGVPLWRQLGAEPKSVAVARPFGRRPSIEELLAEISAVVDAGVGEVTLKLRPGWGIDVVRAVRGTFPALGIRVDFDGTASIEQRDLLFRLQDYQVTAIEQPLDADDLVGHAMLQESLRTPLCLDQTITSADRARQALEMESCREIRISPDLCGGLFAAKEILAACREAGASCFVGTRSGSERSLRQAAALAMLDGIPSSIELDAADSDQRYTDGEKLPPTIDPWKEPGTGIMTSELS